MRLMALPLALTLGLVVLFHSVAVSPGVAGDPRHGAVKVPPAVTGGVLPVVGSRENLKKLLQRAAAARPGFIGHSGMAMRLESAARVAAPEAIPEAPAGADAAAEVKNEAAFSPTNVQVRGVDEADVVKTDGKYIYQVNGQRVVIVEAYPAEAMRVLGSIELSGEHLQPSELYVDDTRLVVLGSAYGEGWRDPGGSGPAVPGFAKPESDIQPPRPGTVTVKLVVYDIRDKARPRKVREAEIAGQYLASRRIGSALYLVANQPVSIPIRQGEAWPFDPPRPSYRDTAAGGRVLQVGYGEIRYFPDALAPNYLVVAGLDLDRPMEAMKVSTYLGGGQTVYASAKNLYVALTRYDPGAERRVFSPIIGPMAATTTVYRFALTGGQATYRAKGEVPGTVLNQFSMDENGGYFRIATTSGQVGRRDEQTSRNNVYILDDAMQVTGRIEDIAPGDRIYSVRFMGNRAYMVTFKRVDPLFVLDLADPRAPKILGALKIPGYSDYLHPYDENHIIGFGKDTIEMGQKGPWGGGADMAYYQGLKIALFDVTNVERPVEKFKEIIGDRGTDSELLRNHKALLFSREKNLLVFPVTLHEVRRTDPGQEGLAYGDFAFQGAYVYRLDLDRGFELRGRITHLSGENYLKAGQGWYDSERNVERSLYIGDTLYTLSRRLIKAHGLGDLAEKGSLDLAEGAVP